MKLLAPWIRLVCWSASVLMLFVSALVAPVGAAPISSASHYITFNQTSASPAPANYVPGLGEVLPVGATMTRQGAPNLTLTPNSAGVREGGGALNTQPLGTRQGYFVSGPNLTGSYTAEMIFQTNSFAPAFQDLFNSESVAGGNGRTILRMQGSNTGSLAYYPLYQGGGPDASNNLVVSNAVIRDQLQHVAIVWEQTGNSGVGTLYVNGLAKGTVNRTGITAANSFSGTFGVASNQTIGNRNLDGHTDAFAVSPGALAPSQFAFSDLKMPGFAFASSAAALPLVHSSSDLLKGLTPTSSLSLIGGALAQLTDGQGATLANGRVVAADSGGAPWVLTYALTTAASLNEIRVFSYNTDGRVFQDYDVETSTDGVTWRLLQEEIRNGTFGFSTNGDDYSMTTLRRLDGGFMTGVVDFLRFTFRPVTNGAGFTTGTRQSALFEIDVFGEPIPEPGALALLLGGVLSIAPVAWRRRRARVA